MMWVAYYLHVLFQLHDVPGAGQFHNVLVKPIVPKQQHSLQATSILTGGGVSNFRPHPHQSKPWPGPVVYYSFQLINNLFVGPLSGQIYSQATPHMTPPISSPILPPPSLSSTYPLAPPTQPSIPLISSHNTLLSPLPNSAYHSLKTQKW